MPEQWNENETHAKALAAIRQVATINFTFSESDLLLFPVKKRNFHRNMYELRFSIQVNTFASKGLLEFRVVGPGGRDMGKASIEYE